MTTAKSNYVKYLALTISGIALIAIIVMLFTYKKPEPEIAVEVPDFASFPAGPERKKAFFDYFVPLIQAENQKVLRQRAELQDWYGDKDDLSSRQSDKIAELALTYELEGFDVSNDGHWQELITRVNTIPVSLALAQGAKESGWGASRFATEGYNYFGQWCYEKGCGLVPKSRGAGKSHEVADFSAPAKSVAAYILNLNTHPAYNDLRQWRAKLTAEGLPVTGLDLSVFLTQYSERRQAYVDEVQSMIRFNKLAQYETTAAE